MPRRFISIFCTSLAAALMLACWPASAVEIRFDYRFDEGQISQHPERRRTLELAAKIWASILPDRFEPIPPGTMLQFNHPVTKEKLSVPMPKHDGDVLVFIFPRLEGKASAAPLSSATSGYGAGRAAFSRNRPIRGTKVSSLYQRANGWPYQPWAGFMNVNFAGAKPWYYAQSMEAVSQIPSVTHWDFLATALHELGHILGFYKDRAPFAFTDLVVNDAFTGPRAMSMNGGRPVPMEPGGSHISEAFYDAAWNGRLVLARPRLEQYLMQSGAHPVQGLRLYPGLLDAAILEDIGYTIAWDRLPRSPYISEYPPPQEQQPNSLVGHWSFARQADLNRAEKGYPLLYRPVEAGIVEDIFRGDHVNIPYRAFFFADHGMAANGGGQGVNQYTLAFDIRLPKLGVEYALLNTAPYGNEPGAVWISPSGKLGQGNYSQEAIAANRWYRIVFSADLARGTRSYYVDGRLVHRQTGEKLDSRFAIRTGQRAFFTLFADSKGEASPLDVRTVALWNYTMADADVLAMGGPAGGQ